MVLVTFLRCSNNNHADTALTRFKDAVEMYGIPSCVHCDLGVENVDIARYMLVVLKCNVWKLNTQSTNRVIMERCQACCSPPVSKPVQLFRNT